MKKVLLFAGLLFVVAELSSCGYFRREKDYNVYYKLSAVNDTLEQMTNTWYRLVMQANTDKNFSTLHQLRLKIGTYVSKNRNIIGDMRLTSEAIPVVDSEMSFLATKAITVSDVYTVFESYNDLTPDGEIRGSIQNLTVIAQKEAATTLRLKKALAVFAYNNKLKIKKEPRGEKK